MSKHKNPSREEDELRDPNDQYFRRDKYQKPLHQMQWSEDEDEGDLED